MLLGGTLIGGEALGIPSVQPITDQDGFAQGGDSGALAVGSDEQYEGPEV